MAMSPEDLQLLRLHLVKSGASAGCPSCGSQKWEPGPIISLSVGEMSEDLQTTKSTDDPLPVVTLLCKQCFYLAHYAWLPIKRGGLK